MSVPEASGDVVVNASVLTTIFSGPEVLEAPVASVTVTVNVEFPDAVGLPVMLTVSVVLDAKERPAGKLPDAIVHDNGGTPPVAVTGSLYDSFRVADGSDVVVITGGGSTFTVSAVDCLGKSTDVAVIVT